MIRTGLMVVGALSCASSALADWVGGAFVTRAAWNAQATEELGQDATVFRLYHAFDRPGDAMLNTFAVTLRASAGTLYQSPLAGDAPPSRELAEFAPSVEWDTFVTSGNRYSPAWTYLAPGFAFTPAGLENSEGWATPGGASAREGQSRLPGSVDFNGDLVIPADFDSRFAYTYWMQVTVLGVSLGDSDPIWDAGFIHSDFFTGTTGITWQTVGSGATPMFQEYGVAIHNPSPGAATAMLLTLGAMASRRRR